MKYFFGMQKDPKKYQFGYRVEPITKWIMFSNEKLKDQTNLPEVKFDLNYMKSSLEIHYHLPYVDVLRTRSTTTCSETPKTRSALPPPHSHTPVSPTRSRQSSEYNAKTLKIFCSDAIFTGRDRI